MWRLAMVLLVVTLVAALLGFGEIVGPDVTHYAQLSFFVGLLSVVVSGAVAISRWPPNGES